MKRFFVIIALLTCFSCAEKVKIRKCSLSVQSGSGLSYSSSIVECDSFQMHSAKEASIWIDGQHMTITAENFILPHTK